MAARFFTPNPLPGLAIGRFVVVAVVVDEELGRGGEEPSFLLISDAPPVDVVLLSSIGGEG